MARHEEDGALFGYDVIDLETRVSAATDERLVFDAWRAGQRAPERCKFTETRKRLIKTRLKSHSAAELQTLIQYAYEADTDEARFWRGDNDSGREYLGLDNLLRAGKLDDRMERAIEWLEGDSLEDPGGPAGADDDGLDLGPMGTFIRGRVQPLADRVDRVVRKVRNVKVRGRTPKNRWD